MGIQARVLGLICLLALTGCTKVTDVSGTTEAAHSQDSIRGMSKHAGLSGPAPDKSGEGLALTANGSATTATFQTGGDPVRVAVGWDPARLSDTPVLQASCSSPFSDRIWQVWQDIEPGDTVRSYSYSAKSLWDACPSFYPQQQISVSVSLRLLAHDLQGAEVFTTVNLEGYQFALDMSPAYEGANCTLSAMGGEVGIGQEALSSMHVDMPFLPRVCGYTQCGNLSAWATFILYWTITGPDGLIAADVPDGYLDVHFPYPGLGSGWFFPQQQDWYVRGFVAEPGDRGTYRFSYKLKDLSGVQACESNAVDVTVNP